MDQQALFSAQFDIIVRFKVLDQDILMIGCQLLRLAVLFDFFNGYAEKAIDAAEEITLHGGAVYFVILYFFSVYGKTEYFAGAPVIFTEKAIRELEPFGPHSFIKGVFAQKKFHDFSELDAGQTKTDHRALVRKGRQEIFHGDDRTQRLGPDGTGSDQDEIGAELRSHALRDQIAELRLRGAARMRIFLCESRKNTPVLGVRYFLVFLYDFFQGEVARAEFLGDRDQFPGIGINQFAARVEEDVKPSDLVCSDRGLYDGDSFNDTGLVKISMACPPMMRSILPSGPSSAASF